MFPRALTRPWVRSCGSIGVVTAALFLSACGGGSRQDANEPRGNFTVSVAKANFPTSQTLSEHTHLVIAVRNDSSKTIPNVAVTISNPQGGTASESFGLFLPQTEVSAGSLASRSRPVWIVDRPPERLVVTNLNKAKPYCAYSCASGGPGGAVTAYTNTWAAGALRPGAIAVFDWGVTAVKSGTYTVQYQIAAGLNGKARAVLSDGTRPVGRFNVTIHNKPAQAYVNDSGQVVQSK